MIIWERAFEVWKNFCPFFKRELITKREMIEWAKEIGLIGQLEGIGFQIFITFLEKAERICPLTFTKKKSM